MNQPTKTRVVTIRKTANGNQVRIRGSVQDVAQGKQAMFKSTKDLSLDEIKAQINGFMISVVPQQ